MRQETTVTQSSNPPRRDVWTADEDTFLRNNYKRMTARTIAERLGRTYMATQTRADTLGLVKRLRMKVGYTQHKWTQEELDYIKENFQEFTCDELADHIGVTTGSLRNQVKKLKLTKTPESLLKIYARVENSGQFKAGEPPLNTLADHEITVRTQYSTGVKTKFIRLSLNKWLPLHQYNWSQAGNDVPEGYVLRFIDGDRMNCDVSNLRLIQRGPHSRDESAAAPTPKTKDQRRAAKRLADSLAKAEAQSAVLQQRQADKKAKADERRKQTEARQAARAELMPAPQAQKRKALAKMSPEDREAERQKTAIIRAEQKRKAKAAKEKQRIEREDESNRKMPTRVIDHSQTVPVYIDKATTIYIKAGQDPDQARNRFLEKRAAALSNLKHATAYILAQVVRHQGCCT
jgi:hypothetical protein